MSTSRSTYVLIPGAGGDAWYWHRVVALLEAAGHEVIAVDLPAADEAKGLHDYAEVVLAAISDRTGVVLTAQSMGAFLVPLVCARADVAQVVLVAPMIPAPGDSPGTWGGPAGMAQAGRAFAEEEGRDPDAPFDVLELFFHDVPEDVVREAFARGEPEQADRPMADTLPTDRWPDVPTRVIAGRRDRLFPLPLVQRLARERLGVEAEVVDTGHLPALARADELAERLLAYEAAAASS